MTTAIRRATSGDLAVLLATVTMWSGAFVAIKVAVPALGPIGVAASRALLGAIVVLPFAAGALRMSLSARAWTILFVLAQLNIALPFVAISWAETRVEASVAALLMGCGPLFAMLSAHAFLEDERMTKGRVAGVALGFGGVAVLVGASALDSSSLEDLPAYGALLAASLCYVTAGLIVRKIDIPTSMLALSTLAIAAATLVPLALFAGPGPEPFTSRTALAVLFLGVFPTGIAYVLRYYLIRKIGYATFAMGINLIPVIGVLLGVLILGEELTPRMLIALALVLAGLMVARKATPA